MRKLLVLIFAFLFFNGCKPKSEYSGFSITQNGLNYQLHAIGDVKKTVSDSDVVDLKYYISSLSDSLVFQSNTTAMYLTDMQFGWNEFLGLLALEDSATMIISPEELSRVNSQLHFSEPMKLTFVPTKISPYLSWVFYEKYPELVEDLELQEQVDLYLYLKTFPSDSIDYHDGIFLINHIVGTGETPQLGNEVAIHYVVKTLNGKELDSTYSRKEPLYYVIGEKDQVLKGFDLGVRKLQKGAKATIVVPSRRAFGEEGSSTGLVKAFEPLIFEVSLIAIQRAD
jgi:FKBP-type peptidyl-prolyl cis-trans isomerase